MKLKHDDCPSMKEWFLETVHIFVELQNDQNRLDRAYVDPVGQPSCFDVWNGRPRARAHEVNSATSYSTQPIGNSRLEKKTKQET